MDWPFRGWLRPRVERRAEFAALFQPYTGEEWVAIDLETTGLDTRRDDILSIAAVPGSPGRIHLRERLVLHIRGPHPRIAEAIRHHRLRAADLADGVSLDEALAQLLALIGNRPLVGYCIAFDIAMLNRALRPRFGFRLPNRRIDVGQEYARRVRRRHPLANPDRRLEAMAAALGLPLFPRHDALGDALSAAAIHLALCGGRG